MVHISYVIYTSVISIIYIIRIFLSTSEEKSTTALLRFKRCFFFKENNLKTLQFISTIFSQFIWAVLSKHFLRYFLNLPLLFFVIFHPPFADFLLSRTGYFLDDISDISSSWDSSKALSLAITGTTSIVLTFIVIFKELLLKGLPKIARDNDDKKEFIHVPLR